MPQRDRQRTLVILAHDERALVVDGVLLVRPVEGLHPEQRVSAHPIRRADQCKQGRLQTVCDASETGLARARVVKWELGFTCSPISTTLVLYGAGWE